MPAPTKREVVREMKFGNQVAEEERELLELYFVKTQAWERIFRGDVDIVYGQKGAGKSAIYVLINDSANLLFDRNILLITAENPRGAPAFKDLVNDPPTSEREFIIIWKLYFVSLIAQTFKEFSINNANSRQVFEILEENDLLPNKKSNLGSILASVRNFVTRVMKPSSIENNFTLDPNTGLVGYSGKISFEQPNISEQNKGYLSVDDLMGLCSSALNDSGYKVWLMIDRLDVAFDESSELEKNALRALFKTYRDIRSLDDIEIKIFLRTDIWKRITEEGFREATHISREIYLNWDKPSLQNLIIRRLLNNHAVIEMFSVDIQSTLSSSGLQEQLFAQIFPEQVEIGERQSTTIDWLLRRTEDATSHSQPRDIILFLNKLCEVQNLRFERGDPEPAASLLFDRAAFKEALPAVSEYRVTKVLFAEYPNLRSFIEALREKKSEQTLDSLSRLWSRSSDETLAIAKQLRDVGFFQERSSKDGLTYWIPFIYRSYLLLSQGKVEDVEA